MRLQINFLYLALVLVELEHPTVKIELKLVLGPIRGGQIDPDHGFLTIRSSSAHEDVVVIPPLKVHPNPFALVGGHLPIVRGEHVHDAQTRIRS